jgi:hypothetical protein
MKMNRKYVEQQDQERVNAFMNFWVAFSEIDIIERENDVFEVISKVSGKKRLWEIPEERIADGYFNQEEAKDVAGYLLGKKSESPSVSIGRVYEV